MGKSATSLINTQYGVPLRRPAASFYNNQNIKAIKDEIHCISSPQLNMHLILLPNTPASPIAHAPCPGPRPRHGPLTAQLRPAQINIGQGQLII